MLADMKNHVYPILLALALLCLPLSQAHGKIIQQSDTGFLVTHMAEIEAGPDEIWRRLIKPSAWWDSDFSWSGSSDGLYLDEKAGGCFCEKLPADKGAGSVEHMRVIHFSKGKVLRMQGAIGPLQSEAMLGTFTAVIAPVPDRPGMSRVSFSYIAGGYMRFPMKRMAENIDKVIGVQFASLIRPFLPKPDNAGGFKLDLDDLPGDAQDAASSAEPDEAPKSGEKGR